MDDILKFTTQYNSLKPLNVGTEASAGKFVKDTCVMLPSEFGQFKLISFVNHSSGEVCLAIVKGNVKGKSDVPMRIHSSCVTGDILGSHRCDCGKQLVKALKFIEKNGLGVVVYAFQEGRGIGLINKLRAYLLQESGMDTVEANFALGFPEDLRKYDFVVDVLEELGVKSVKLMTNNPDKVEQLQNQGIAVTGVIKHEVKPCDVNLVYLKTKKLKMGHSLSLV